MMRSDEQVIRGIVSYIDNEVMPKMTTAGKWMVGAWTVLAAEKASSVIHVVLSHPAVTSLGVVDGSGMIDIDRIEKAFVESAERCGTIYIDIPMIGRMSYSAADIHNIASYINRQ